MSAAAPRTLLDADAISATVDRLAAELDAVCSDGTVMVGVLTGSVPLLADLVRAVRFVAVVDFLAVSRYGPGRPRAKLVHDLTIDISGRDVVVVEDVVDTGLTLAWLLDELGRRDPRSVRVCALVDKPRRRLAPVELHHVGIATDADYVIGYGIDHAGRYRGRPDIVVADLARLRDDPDAYEPIRPPLLPGAVPER
ncbi:MAG TPA: phosphoribosyltransferase family protein [Acidimicrobiales bacterium]|nr:phosphoribosyltransferase family protein [Acidimicrobiales bacterium]